MNTMTMRINGPLPFATADDIAAGRQAEERRTKAKEAAKLANAREYLGTRGMAHPAYQFTDRHSPKIETWWPHRTLRAVEDAAREAGRL